MKYLKSLLFSLVLVFIFGVAVTSTTVYAAPSKPTVPKTFDIAEGMHEQFYITANGWEIKSVKTKVSKKGIAGVATEDDIISITGIKEGKTVLTTTIKASKSGKTKNFKLKMKITVTHTDELIPFNIIDSANSYDTVFAKHTNFLYDGKACDDTAAKLLGRSSKSYYCDGSKVFLSEGIYDQDNPKNKVNLIGYLDAFADYLKYDNAPSNIVMNLYAMPIIHKEEERVRTFTNPYTTDPILCDHCLSEETFNVRKVKDELVVSTYAEYAYAAPYNSATLKIEYYVDANTYEVHKIDTFYHTTGKDYPFTTATITYDTRMPFDTADLEEYAHYVEGQTFDNPQTITITYYADEEDEENYTGIINKGMPVNFCLLTSYNLFWDKEGTKPFEGLSKEDNIQLYAIYDDSDDF